MDKYNNKQRSIHWSGRVYITYNSNMIGGNICIDPKDDDNFMVIAYTHQEITEDVIRSQLKSWGYDPDYWLKNERKDDKK